MTSQELLDATFDGYLRGILGLPWSVDDVGLTLDQKQAKYSRILEDRQKRPRAHA